MKLEMDFDEFLKLPRDERLKVIKEQFGEPKDRYYFWEICPSYGQRSLGRLEGYETINELKRDMKYEIASNLENGTPTYILKSEVVREIV